MVSVNQGKKVIGEKVKLSNSFHSPTCTMTKILYLMSTLYAGTVLGNCVVRQMYSTQCPAVVCPVEYMMTIKATTCYEWWVTKSILRKILYFWLVKISVIHHIILFLVYSVLWFIEFHINNKTSRHKTFNLRDTFFLCFSEWYIKYTVHVYTSSLAYKNIKTFSFFMSASGFSLFEVYVNLKDKTAMKRTNRDTFYLFSLLSSI